MADERPFSRRHGYLPHDVPITIRDDAPDGLRRGIIALAKRLGVPPEVARDEVCAQLFTSPDSETNHYEISFEITEILLRAPWYRVYDIAESFWLELYRINGNEREFEARLNDYMIEQGIGWKMEDGKFIVRGSESFESATHAARDALSESGQNTAALEIGEALSDLSRRPKPDITGAVQHAIAALECTARHVTCKYNKTLGQLIPELGLEKPLDLAITKLWGFASEQARHLREGRDLSFRDAELVVTVASAVSIYLTKVATDTTQAS